MNSVVGVINTSNIETALSLISSLSLQVVRN